MSKLIVKNSASLLGAELISKLIYIIFFAFLARYLPSSDIGIYITLLTFISFGLFFSDPGISQTLIRNISRDQTRVSVELRHGITLSTCFWLVAWGGMIIIAHIFDFPEKLIPLLAISGIALVFESWAQMASAYIRAKQRMEIIAFGNSLGLIIFSALGIYLLFKGLGLPELVVLIILRSIFNCIFFGWISVRLGLSLPHIKFDFSGVAIFIKEAIPIALLIGCNIALNNVDIVMLSKMKGMSDTAIYGLAVRLISTLYLLSGSVLGALFPFFSSQWGKLNSKIYKTFQYSFKFFLVIGLISVAIFSIFCKEVIVLFYSHNFIRSADVLFILVWSFLFSMLGAPISLLIVNEKNRIFKFVPIAIGVVILNILLNLWLIPVYSYIGASISTLMCSVVLYLLKVRFVKAFFPMRMSVYKTGFKPLLAILSMSIVFWLTKGRGILLPLTFGGSLFFIILWALGEFKGEEYSFLNRQIALNK